jgi:hypothetical protein
MRLLSLHLRVDGRSFIVNAGSALFAGVEEPLRHLRIRSRQVTDIILTNVGGGLSLGLSYTE